ncbi:MAG: NAD(P)H-dependent glycerol-3-phosphate dehydrogenase, partial [Chloroflexota bacterium]|nr:NAD(P)H-dependent glycerol-3-phosphate dehydrogenase [Chloroflexota bacterium]
TCFNHNSRNNQLGTLIAKGNNLITAQEKILGVVEGINSTKIMNEILIQNKIEAPIIYEIYKVLFESKNPKIGIEDLMKRDYSKE